jgi:hypothetical protein
LARERELRLAKVRDRLRLALNLERLHFFDPTTEAAI